MGMEGHLGVGHGTSEEQRGNTVSCSEDSGRGRCKGWKAEKAGHFTQISSQTEHVSLPQTDT